MSIKRWRVGLLGVLISIAAAYFVVSQMDLARLGVALSTARWGYIPLCALLLVAALIPRALRWNALLSYSLPYWRAFNIMNVAYLVNGVLPLRVGEVARAYLATRSDPPVPVFKTVSTIIVERLLDLLAVVAMLGVALAAGPLPDAIRKPAIVLGPLALIGFLLAIFLASQRVWVLQLFEAISRRAPVARQLNLTHWTIQFLDGLTPLTKPKALLQAIGLTAAGWGLSIAAGYVLMLTFYERASLATTCLYIAAAGLAIALPAVPGNIGTYELSVLLALEATGYGQPANTAVLFAILVHGINLIVHATMGVFGFIQEGISLEQLSQGVRGMQHSNVGSNVQ